MGEAVNRKTMALSSPRRLELALVASVALVVAGCASARSERPTQAAVSSSPVVAAAPPVVEVAAVELFEGAPGTRIQVRAAGELVWTSYRNAGGDLVIELPNSRPSEAVPTRIPGLGAVASVRVEEENGTARPLTRLVVSSAGETEHSIAASPGGLLLDFVPVGESIATSASPVAATAPPVAPPAGEMGSVIEPVASVPAEPVQPSRAPGAGVAVAATERPATRLEGSEVLSQGREATIRVVGDGAIAYNSFRLEDPPRLVLDLEGLVNAAPRGVWVLDGVAVSRVRVSQFRPHPEPVTRVVFDLTQAGELWVERQPAALLVRFGGSGAAPTPTLAESVAAVPLPAPAPAPAESPAPAPPPQPAEPAAVTVAAASPVPAAPARNTDVEAFGVPTPPAAPPARVPVAAFEASDVQPPQGGAQRATGEEGQRPAAGTGMVLPGQRKEYVGEPISLDLKDADVRDVLRSFAKLSGLNIVVQPGVRGSVTVLLENVPWDQALDQILKINGLAYELDGSIMRIAPVATLENEARKAQQLAQAQALSIPLRTVVKRLSYSTAQDMQRILQTGGRGGGSILSQRGSVTIDSRTNTLIIKELPTYIDTVLAVIETLDIPEPQVMIEARIAETTKRFSRALGIRWGFEAIADPAYGNSTGLVFPNNIESSGGVNLLTGGANGFINLALGNVLDTFQLDARLQAAEAEGLINVISSPKIAVLNNETANIQSGLQIPIQTVANNTVSVQFVNATLQLRVTPHVTAEGTVLMDLNIQKREPQLAFAVVGATNAPIATKEARTRVIVRDGGTTVIGGIYEVTSDQGQDRVPGLSNVPLLGHLFKNRRRLDENKELLIFITPRVIKL